MKKLKFKFDPNQEYQLEAIENVVSIFEGFPKTETGFGISDDIKPNLPMYDGLEDSWLLDNLIQVQQTFNEKAKARGSNLIPQSFILEKDQGFMIEEVGFGSYSYPAFTVEMETGTGKTYVYLRTIYELRKRYGFRKFIIIVPSVAIYEGVLKTFEITKEHFKSLYENENVHLTAYSSDRISNLRNYATSSFTEILLMTIDSFNKSSNNIYKSTEKLPGELLPYQYIQSTRPILILDESQNYVSDKSREALRTLKPLFALNYSATPEERPNPVYRLSPVDAFRMNLVKRIEVEGVTERYNYNNTQLSLQLADQKTGYGLAVHARLFVMAGKEAKEEKLLLKKNDDLYQRTKNEAYKGLVIDEINAGEGIVVISGEEYSLNEGNDLSLSQEEIFRVQIEETIKFHFRKQKDLLEKGIKVLSLFFIDKVDNYTKDDGIIKKLFDESFNKLKQEYPYWRGWDADQVREGYFAKKKEKNKESYVDTGIEKKSAEDRKAEAAAYELIMRNKEKLLGFEEKISFIFAHSALKEGWDNPNVFQICTLNTTYSERRKRQEIGRGLRLAVNQNGERTFDEQINILTVIANESYESYVASLQAGYIESGDAAPPAPTRAQKSFAKRNDKIYNGEEFKKFWDKLLHQTTYQIHLEPDQLIKDCINKLNSAKYPEPHIVITKGRFVTTEFSISLREVKGGMAGLDIKITDNTGLNEVKSSWAAKGDDLYKKSKDPRLKGFKIVEILSRGESSEVIFGDRGRLRIGEPLVFSTEKGVEADPRATREAQTTYPVFNLIERTTKETNLTRKSVLSIFKAINSELKNKIFRNPEGFASVFIQNIKDVLATHVATNIKYTLSGNKLDFSLDEAFPKEKLFPQKELIDGSKYSVYDKIQYDSDIEKNFVEYRLNTDDKVLCYFKFPSTFKINIPKIIGNYNPDWGIIRWDEDGKLKLELVRETKGNIDPNLLQYPNEKRKIDCAAKHFNLIGINYKQIKGDELNWWK